MNFEITKEFVRKVTKYFNHGLPEGMGDGGRGQMCMQHVISYCMGEGHDDSPSCVAPGVRCAGITLNDMAWSSKRNRGRALKRLAVAQLGSSSVIDSPKFRTREAEIYQKHNVYHEDSNEEGRCLDGTKQDDHIAAQIAEELVQVLIEMKSPGCEFLDCIE